MIEIIKATFAAGEIKTFQIQGEYFEIIEAAGPLDVYMMDRGGVQLGIMIKAEASYFSRPGKYEVVQITSATAQTIRFFVGSGDAGTRRTTGDVTVPDLLKARTIAGTAFSGVITSAPVAGMLPTVAAYATGAGNKNVFVEKFIFASATAQKIRWGIANSGGGIVSVGAFTNKKIPGPAIGSVVRQAGNIAGQMPGFAFMGLIDVAANAPYSHELREPIQITPGWYFVIQGETANTDLTVTMELFEEPA